MTRRLVRGERYGTGYCPNCGEYVIGGVYDSDSQTGPFCDEECALAHNAAPCRLVAALAADEDEGAEPMDIPDEDGPGARLHLGA